MAKAKKPAKKAPKKKSLECALCGKDIRPKKKKAKYCPECEASYCIEHWRITCWAHPHQTVDDRYRETTCPKGHEDWEKEPEY